MGMKFHTVLTVCAGALALTAAGVAPAAGDETTTALPAVWQEPAPAVVNPPVTPTLFPDAADLDPAGPANSLGETPPPREPGAGISEEERRCLAIAVYHESRGEPRAGQMAVAQVIVNRAKSGRYPRSLCGVIRQPSQFNGLANVNYAPRPGSDWRIAQDVAADVLEGERHAAAQGAMFFHATRVQPSWRGRVRLATIGNHVFYR